MEKYFSSNLLKGIEYEIIVIEKTVEESYDTDLSPSPADLTTDSLVSSCPNVSIAL